MHCHANGSTHQKEVFVSQILLMRERRSLDLASFSWDLESITRASVERGQTNGIYSKPT